MLAGSSSGYNHLSVRLVSLANGLGHATTWQYDARDRVTSETDPAGKSTTYSYDANGNVTGRIDRLGTSVTRTYGNMDQLTAVSVNRAAGVLGTTSETIQYDLLGQLMSWTDNDSTLEWSYDSLGRTVSEKSGANPIGTTGKTFSFGYDSTGNTTSIGYPDGTTLNYARDAIGRMTSASLQGGATLGTYQYAGSRVLSIALQNAVTKTLTYDAAWRATFVEYKKAATSIKKFEYAWNVADKRVLEKRHHSGGTGDNYDLDSLYRSIQVKAGVADPVAELANPGSQTVASTTGLTMDTANNRTQRVVTTGAGQTTTNYTADVLEFYTSVGGTAQTRDANGNLRDDGTNLYAYDYRNRLVTVTRKSDSVVIASYEYDSLSRRIGVTTSTGTARHCWIGAQLAMEYGSNGGVVSRRHYGANAGEVLAAQQLDVADLDGDGSTVDSVSITPLYDGAFDCVGSLDQTGALAESYVHSFDGTVTITNGAGQAIAASAIGWQQGYGRGYRDTQTGFVYNLHRYYNPSTGRFLTQDPLGRWYDASSLGNGYAWVGNGYRNAWDPTGLKGDTRPGARTHRPKGDKALSAVVEVLKTAIKEASSGKVKMPKNVADQLDDKDIDWESGALGVDVMGVAYQTRTKEGKYVVQINLYRNETFNKFMRTLVHEMQHVKRWKAGDMCDWHATRKKYDEFDVPVLRAEEYLRKRSKTLVLFEDWIKRLQPTGRRSVFATVQEAADNALAGKPVPSKKKK